MLEGTFLKKLMLTGQANQKSVFFVTIGTFLINGLILNSMQWLLWCINNTMSMNLSYIVILNINGTDYCCFTNRISKSEAINLMNYSNLTKKSEMLNYNFLCIRDG